MYKHILITTDGSDTAAQGVEHGVALAAATGARVIFLTVTAPYPIMASLTSVRGYATAEMIQDYEDRQQEAARQILQTCAATAARMGVNASALHIPDAHPAEAILRTAREKGCDLICMASHGRRGMKRLVLGSQAAEVVSQAEIPVLIVRSERDPK